MREVDFLQAYFNKKFNYILPSGSDALVLAIRLSKSKKVATPGLSCDALPDSIKNAGAVPVFVDINSQLQIDLKLVPHNIDAIIVPHTFGIITDLSQFKRMRPNVTIIEDCSQAGGYTNFGRFSDFVVTSTGKSKWHNVGYGGVLSTNVEIELEEIEYCMEDFRKIFTLSQLILRHRHEKFISLQNQFPHITFIKGKVNSFHRAMYLSKSDNILPIYTNHAPDQLKNTTQILRSLTWKSIHYDQ